MCADAKSHNYMYNAYADFNMLHRPEIFEKYEPDSFSFLFCFTAAPTPLLFFFYYELTPTQTSRALPHWQLAEGLMSRHGSMEKSICFCLDYSEQYNFNLNPSPSLLIVSVNLI